MHFTDAASALPRKATEYTINGALELRHQYMHVCAIRRKSNQVLDNKPPLSVRFVRYR